VYSGLALQADALSDRVDLRSGEGRARAHLEPNQSLDRREFFAVRASTWPFTLMLHQVTATNAKFFFALAYDVIPSLA